MKTIILTLTMLLLFPLLAGCSWMLPDLEFVYVSPSGASLTCTRKGGGASIDPSVGTTLGDIIKHKATLAAQKAQIENEIKTMQKEEINASNNGKAKDFQANFELTELKKQDEGLKTQIETLNKDISRLLLKEDNDILTLIKECDEFLDIFNYPNYPGYKG